MTDICGLPECVEARKELAELRQLRDAFFWKLFSCNLPHPAPHPAPPGNVAPHKGMSLLEYLTEPPNQTDPAGGGSTMGEA